MDYVEKSIHKILEVSSYKTLKDEFYKKRSPLSRFYTEYKNQYHQYTAYIKLYFAYTNLQELINPSATEKPELNIRMHIDSFITESISVCDILSKQIYIVSTEDLDKIHRIYIHKLNNYIEKNNRLYNKYFKKIIGVVENSAWYKELKNYRNGIAHGMLRILSLNNNGRIQMPKIETPEKEEDFEFLVKSLPVHCKKPPSDEDKKRLENMFCRETIITQFETYYDNVKTLASDVWSKMTKLYEDESKDADWKL
jgi:hypothetical protein